MHFMHSLHVKESREKRALFSRLSLKIKEKFCRRNAVQDQRRSFLKKALGTGAVVAAVGVSAIASDKGAYTAGSNGVVVGKSNKKEILYKKTANWEAYYHAAV